MMKDGIFIEPTDGINLYVNGKSHHYDSFYQSGRNKSCFLIPKTHLETFRNDLKIGNVIVFRNSKNEWIMIEISDQSTHENIWRNEDHFEYVAWGEHHILDEVALRDLKLSFFLDDKYQNFF